MMKNRGVTLITLIVGMAILMALSAALMKEFGGMMKSNKRVGDEIDRSKAINTINNYFKSQLEGTKNFQGLSFRVPDSPALQIDSVGFYVETDTNFADGTSTGNDRLTIMLGVPLGVTFKVKDAYPANSLKIYTEDATKNVGDYFKAGDLIVLSRVLKSEVVQVGPSGPSTIAGPEATYSDINFEYTFQAKNLAAPTSVTNTYDTDDYVYKGKILRIGLDTTTHELKVKNMADNSVVVIGKDVNSFSIAYHFKGDKCITCADTQCTSCPCTFCLSTEVCNDFQTPADTFSRTNWAEINRDTTAGNSTGVCYSKMDQMEITYKVGKDPANTGEKTGKYTFFVAN